MSDADGKILIVTRSFPPMKSGSAVLLHQLLSPLPPQRFVAVHGVSEQMRMDGDDLGVERHVVKMPGSPKWSTRFERRWPGPYLARVRRRVERVVREHDIRRIYAHYPSGTFVVAAWQVARKLSLPMTLYFDIVWEEHAPAAQARLAREHEHAIAEYADRRFAITESAAEYLSEKHGMEWELIPHTTDVKGLNETFRERDPGARPVVHFAGGIYPAMNQDAVVRLADAVQRCRTRPELDFCTGALPEVLQARGIATRYLSLDELLDAQRAASILYLPQAFESGHPMMIRHNFPTKAMEYFKAGRPILVHAPGDCYLSWLAEKEGFARVVSEPDVTALADAIDDLIEDRDAQESLVRKALAFVKTRDNRVWSQRLWSALWPPAASG